MKLLLASDLHASRDAAVSLARRAGSVDLLVVAGDFANERRQISVCIDILKSVEKPVVMVAGNNETTEELRAACKGWSSAHILHGSSVEIGGVTFFGLPGAVPVTPFGAWSFDFTEEQAAKLLAPCPPGCVLITHSPPHGTLDRSTQGFNFGSTAVRDSILRLVPTLVVCGHIHACAGRMVQLGGVPVVNAGPNGIEWTLQNTATPASP